MITPVFLNRCTAVVPSFKPNSKHGLLFRQYYCSQFDGPDKAECEHFVNDFGKLSFAELGAHLVASATDACDSLFECSAQPTDAPTGAPIHVGLF